MKDNKPPKKNSILTYVIVVAVALAVLSPELLSVVITVGIVVGVVYLAIRVSKQKKAPSEKTPAAPERQPAFDECPAPVCFHKDKGEHHVRRGKEIDPWDRPDIDISKYQHQ